MFGTQQLALFVGSGLLLPITLGQDTMHIGGRRTTGALFVGLRIRLAASK